MVRTLLPYFSFGKKKPKAKFVITIPEPCSEDWNKMKVVGELHRHCSACERTLVDFSVMSDDELVIFFKQNKGKVCGRFRKDQTNRNLTQLPEKTFKAKWWKAAALLPLSLFSKNVGAQQLPDSLQTTQTPMMVLPDSASKCEPLVVDWGHQPPGLQEWEWKCGEGYVMGVPPITTTGYVVTLCLTDLWVDSTALIPHADSDVGMKAKVTAPNKIPNAGAASGFAENIKATKTKKEE